MEKSETFGKYNNFEVLEKMGADNPGDLPSMFENLEYGINIFQKTWNEWDRYLPSEYGIILESLKLWIFESLKLRNQENKKFETNKLWNFDCFYFQVRESPLAFKLALKWHELYTTIEWQMTWIYWVINWQLNGNWMNFKIILHDQWQEIIKHVHYPTTLNVFNIQILGFGDMFKLLFSPI